MLAQLMSAAVQGIDPYLVRVEVNVASGLPAFSVVGLPQGAVREGRDRVMAALQNVGLAPAPRRVTVNLAPADVRKDGSAFDLPIALGLAAAGEAVPAASLEGTAFVGELGLDGKIRPVRGCIAIAAACSKGDLRTLVVPAANAAEAAVVDGLEVLGADDLSSVIEHFAGRGRLRPVRTDTEQLLATSRCPGSDLADVRGQRAAKRALEISAAGGHNLLMIGPPGAGKSMLARRLSGLLPRLTLDEALEVTRIHSVAGTLDHETPLVRARPFRAPHHTVSAAGLAGGGTPPRPGEISLAHHGVLFLDELPEFRRHVLEVLRQPAESGWVTIARAGAALRFPARFVLVGAMNPCPCGYYGDGSDRCTCDVPLVGRYRRRLSGPLLDRIELRVDVRALSAGELESPAPRSESESARSRVDAARRRQSERFARVAEVHCNAQMNPAYLRRWCRLDDRSTRLLRKATEQLLLSARAYHRVLKVARTVADLESLERIEADHVAEALHYR